MSVEIVNLRRVRKAKQRVEHADAGAENRARHGRTRAEKDGQALEAIREPARSTGITVARLTMPTSGGPATIIKHSLVIAGHRTSISLEDAFWTALKLIAAARDLSVAALVAEIDECRGDANLSSAIRVAVLAASSS